MPAPYSNPREPSRPRRGSVDASHGIRGLQQIPPGRSAVDSVGIIHAKEIRRATSRTSSHGASTKFLFLFQGVAYDYSVYDEAVLQRDMARVERFYRSKGFLDAHARVAHVATVAGNHVRVEIVVDEGPPTPNRNIVIAGLEGFPRRWWTPHGAGGEDHSETRSAARRRQFKESEAA